MPDIERFSGTPRNRNFTFRRFADWLRSPHAPDVAMIAGVHHAPMTRAAFLELADGPA